MIRLRVPSPSALIGFSIILSVALYTRFSELSTHIVFFGDVARTMLAGRNILLGVPVLTGPLTSIPGFHLGPLYYYFTALALKLSNFDPIGPAFMVSSFGVGAVVLLYLYLRKYWGETAAIMGGLMFAFSPLVMLQSRIPIEPSPLPFFVLGWLLFTTRFLETRKNYLLAFSGACIVIGAQLNFSAIVLVPITFLAWLMTEKKISPSRRRQLLLLIASAISAVTIARVLWKPSTTLTYLWTTWQQLTFTDLNMISTFMFVFFLVSVWLVNRGEGGEHEPAGRRLLLFLWGFIAMCGFVLKTVNGQHALALLFPYPFIFLGIGWQRATEGWKKTLTVMVTVAFGCFLAWEARGVLQNWQGGMVADAQAIANEILAQAKGEPYALIYKGHLDVYDAADDHLQYLLWRSGSPPVDAARIGFYQETRDQWLLNPSSTEVQRVITVYIPAPPETGFSLEVAER